MLYNDAVERFEHSKVLLAELSCNLKNKELLDVGCGIGNTLLAAIQSGCRKCVGIDINLSDFGETHFKTIADQNDIDISKTEMIEGSLDQQHFDNNRFDVITLIDVIEHVSDPRAILMEINRILKPGGHFLLDVCPLYYSQVGHHLYNHFPRERYPWVHLYHDFDKLLQENHIDDWSLQHHKELNKVTRSELLNIIQSLDFKILQHISNSSGKEDYSRVKYRINHDLLPSKDDLFIEWNRFLMTR